MATPKQRSNPYILMVKLGKVSDILSDVQMLIELRESDHELWRSAATFVEKALAAVSTARLDLNAVRNYNDSKEQEKI